MDEVSVMGQNAPFFSLFYGHVIGLYAVCGQDDALMPQVVGVGPKPKMHGQAVYA